MWTNEFHYVLIIKQIYFHLFSFFLLQESCFTFALKKCQNKFWQSMFSAKSRNAQMFFAFLRCIATKCPDSGDL